MKLSQLLLSAGISYNGADREILSVTSDIGRVCKGSLYVCHHKNSELITRAKAEGAVCAAAMEGADIVCDNPRRLLALCMAAFCGNPQNKLRVIGVTGTNGKTTVTSLLTHILQRSGRRCKLIGTNNCGGYTTPVPEILYPAMAQAVREGCQDFIMEVSSHSLDQSRVAPIIFDCAVFTNLTRDHLDYHLTFDAYSKAKQKLFAQCKTAVINADSPYAEQMASVCPHYCTYGIHEGEHRIENLRCDISGVHYRLDDMDIIFGVPGQFSAYNSACALLSARQLGVSKEAVVSAVQSFAGVDGRMEILDTKTDFCVIIDYAHTPDGLKNVLQSLNEIKKGRLIVVFGAGGQRDRGKRAQMFDVCAKTADYVVITSDNPRKENPFVIIKDILSGLNGYTTPFAVLENRRAATEFALGEAKAGDIVLLAGKGHERYQQIGERCVPYDERMVVSEILTRR